MKRKRRGNGERMRKWRENFLILPLYPPSLSISYIKIGHILLQNVKYGIFVANVTKTEHTRYEEIILNSLRGSSASCVGLPHCKFLIKIVIVRLSMSFFDCHRLIVIVWLSDHHCLIMFAQIAKWFPLMWHRRLCSRRIDESGEQERGLCSLCHCGGLCNTSPCCVDYRLDLCGSMCGLVRLSSYVENL